MTPTRSQGLQALYTIRELADMVGISKARLGRLLDRAKVEYVMLGRDRCVPVSELEDKCKNLWSSAKFVHHLRKIERARYERLLSISEEAANHDDP